MFTTSVSPKSLFEHARKVFDLTPFAHNEEIANVAGRVFDEPLWLGENLLLAQSHWSNGAFYKAYRLDLGRHRLLPCPRLSKIIDDFRGAWSLSSDRQWVLWREGWLWLEPLFTATRIDGGHSIRWAVRGEEEHKTPFFWLPDSTYWIRLLRGEDTNTFVGVRLYDLNHSHWSKRISFPTIKNAWPLGVLANGTILLSDWDGDGFTNRERRTLTITTLHLGNGHPRIQTFRLPVPAQGVLRNLCPTLDGKHLAWLILQGHVKPDGDYNAKQAVLLVSGLDGRNARSLGVLPFRYESDDYNTYLHSWFPDAKRVLLEARHQLFSVPVGAPLKR